MAVPRLLLDEMLSPATARQLEGHGLHVHAVAARPDLVGRPDEQVLLVATTERRCLVTADVSDFTVLDGLWRCTGREHAGILLVVAGRFLRRHQGVGAVVSALAALAAAGGLPLPGEVRFLAAPGP